jgi:hypothetical protein
MVGGLTAAGAVSGTDAFKAAGASAKAANNAII